MRDEKRNSWPDCLTTSELKLSATTSAVRETIPMIRFGDSDVKRQTKVNCPTSSG